MRVVVTGASGHLGANLVRRLLEGGGRVRAVVRTRTRAIEGLDVEAVRGDVLDPGSLRGAFAGAEVVYHLAGVVSIRGDAGGRVWAVNADGADNPPGPPSSAGYGAWCAAPRCTPSTCGPGPARSTRPPPGCPPTRGAIPPTTAPRPRGSAGCGRPSPAASTRWWSTLRAPSARATLSRRAWASSSSACTGAPSPPWSTGAATSSTSAMWPGQWWPRPRAAAPGRATCSRATPGGWPTSPQWRQRSPGDGLPGPSCRCGWPGPGRPCWPWLPPPAGPSLCTPLSRYGSCASAAASTQPKPPGTWASALPIEESVGDIYRWFAAQGMLDAQPRSGLRGPAGSA